MASKPMKSPQDVLDRFAKAWAERDGDAIAALFVEDPQFVNVTGLWWQNRRRITIAHNYGFDRIFGDSKMEFTNSNVRYIGKDAAVVHGQWTIEVQTASDGRSTETRQGILIFVMEKVGDQWKVVAAQNTDIIAGAESIAVIDGKSVPQSYQDSPTKQGR